MTLSVLELMRLQQEALFISNEQGRLCYVRDPGYAESELDPAPRFFMGRTAEGHTWSFGSALAAAAAQQIDTLCREEPLAQDLENPPVYAEQILNIVQSQGPISDEYRGPAFWIPEREELHSSGELVLLSEQNAELLTAYFPLRITGRAGFRIGPMAAYLVDGQAVSICYCSRITNYVAEAGVETIDLARGQGFASAAVAYWAQAVRRLGLLPLYSTEWTNHASRGVARRLGMICYGEDWSIV